MATDKNTIETLSVVLETLPKGMILRSWDGEVESMVGRILHDMMSVDSGKRYPSGRCMVHEAAYTTVHLFDGGHLVEPPVFREVTKQEINNRGRAQGEE